MYDEVVREAPAILEAIQSWPTGEPFPVSLLEAERLIAYLPKEMFRGLVDRDDPLGLLSVMLDGKFTLMDHQIRVLL